MKEPPTRRRREVNRDEDSIVISATLRNMPPNSPLPEGAYDDAFQAYIKLCRTNPELISWGFETRRNVAFVFFVGIQELAAILEGWIN